MKHYHLLILLLCILSNSCGCPSLTFVNYENIKVHSTNSNAPLTNVYLHHYGKRLNGKWGRTSCFIEQEFDNWNNVCVNKENIKIYKSGKNLEFKLHTFNEIENKECYISNSDYYLDNSSSLFIEIEERLYFGDSLFIEEYNLPYKGDTTHIDIKFPDYPKEDKRGRTPVDS